MSKWIENWDPEDDAFWERQGKAIARRNLIWSILAENLGFSVWLVWSIAATKLPAVGFKYTTAQLFTLVSLPGLIGSIMRFPYTFAVPRFGGRNWTVVSVLLLLIPSTALVVLVRHPQTPFWIMALAASTAGLGGGNFASSMANISFFYPDRKKGFALGLNAAGGNVGVSIVQLLVPIVIAIGATRGTPRLENAGLMWMPLIVLSALGAFFFMNNLSSARSGFGDQLAMARRRQTWIMSFLYIGTFGSFVGYSAAFPLLLKTQFPAITASLAFLGPLVGSLSRPLGGLLSDRVGGARVTFWNFVAMGAATLAVVYCIDHRSFAGFLFAFMVLFTTSGIGNGSTFRMIPAIFRAEKLRSVQGASADAVAVAMAAARRETAAVLGLTSAVGAMGGFFIPRALGASITATGGASTAFGAFFVCYAVCGAVTWWYYLRKSFLVGLLPSFAHAGA